MVRPIYYLKSLRNLYTREEISTPLSVCACVCMHACVRVCVRARARACVRVCICVDLCNVGKSTSILM